MIDVIVIIFAACSVLGVIIASIIRKKRGIPTGCGCCPQRGKCTACPSKPKKDEKQ